MATARTVYGLTSDEQAELESEDEEFFGELEESQATESENEGDHEEFGEQGILDQSELEARVLRVTGQRESDSESDEVEGGDLNSSLISPDSDPLHAKLTNKFELGCSCADNCLSRFTVTEAYSFILSLYVR